MRNGFLVKIALALVALVITSFAFAADVGDPLPSWREGPVKRNIIEFVQAVTDSSSRDFVPKENRIATIDNDGTLWLEQPLYTQEIFMLSRYQNLAKAHRSWPKINEKNLTQKNMERLFTTTSAGISIGEYEIIVKEWLDSARNPRYKRPYTELIYQPMIEVINYLTENDFDVYIVSGGGQEFMRAFALPTYGITSDHVIGSTAKTQYTYKNGKPVLMKVAQPLFVSDKTGKPEAINLFIGKKPIIAFGNSDGDREMLEWTQSSPGKHLMLLVHHDDAEREYAYDTKSKVGTFSKSLMQEAQAKDWQVISMKDDWKVIFPFETAQAASY
jgi:hypothetical protein